MKIPVMEEKLSSENFTRRESDIVHRCQQYGRTLKSATASLHILDGFQRRVFLMQANRFHIEHVAKPGRKEVLNVYQCSELNVHLNSYYVQLRGALDNLAWGLHYEFAILGPQTEADPRTRSRCNLFDNRFLAPLQDTHTKLAVMLRGKQQWFEEFKERRDPVAHRIPLYAMPGVIKEGSAEEAEMRRLYAEFNDSIARGALEEGISKWFQSARIGKYEPWFVQYAVDGYSIRNLPDQVGADQAEFLSVSEAVLGELFAGRS
jgi:hypothetical protein